MSAEARTYADALHAMYALVPRGIVLGLDPIREALAHWGSPQEKLRAVHVAGTNGKGSVAAMVDAGLRASGRRVGLYTSPHLHRFAERIRVDGESADDATLTRAAWRVLDAVRREEIPALTFFEAATMVAWDVFAASGLDLAVLEVGLGGRLDATNVCSPVVTAITRIARDHEARLGESLAEIAGEKAGILKPGVACVLGAGLREGEARRAIELAAGRVGATLCEAPAARVLSMDGRLRARAEVDAAGGSLTLDLALAGGFQVENAAIAVAVLERLGVSHAHIAAGLGTVVWPARLERIENVLFDVAHNPDGADALAASIERLGVARDRTALVFGASSDKDWRAMLDRLGPLFAPSRRFFGAALLRRAESPSVLAAHAGGQPSASVRDALDAARASVGGEGLVVVCGSIFAVAEARAGLLGLASDPPVPM
ncbi:MAG: folylpolyglutamate synthase/dihydrofolate synthase family protein [Deltaproteobacteria bacterium]